MTKTPQYNVIVSERARHMLGTHLRFLANASPSAAQKTKSEIMKMIRSLSIMPQRLPFLDVEHIPPNKYHKALVEQRYLILYQIRDDVVYVDDIVDCRQDYQWLLR